MRRGFFVFWLLFLFLFPGRFSDGADGSIDARIRSLLSTRQNKKTHFSVHIYDLADKQTVFSFNADRPLKPASNMKLITTAAAVDLLGLDFAYQTIYGLLGDDLVIIGSGDPLAGDPVIAEREDKSIYDTFEKLYEKIKQRNITRINGNLLIDNFIFDDVRFHQSWPENQADKWYTAQVSGLNFHDNCLDIMFNPTKTGQKVRYKAIPKTNYANITNKCMTKAKGDPVVGAARKVDTNNITLIGSCAKPLVKPISVTIDRPSAYHGYVLAEFLLNKGIAINGNDGLIIKKLCQSNGQLPKGLDVLHRRSRTLAEILPECNQRSLNLAAECLFKTVGYYYQRKLMTKKLPNDVGYVHGSWATGREAVMAFLNKLEIPSQQYNIDDGSGLSPGNLVSARCITTVLAHMYSHQGYDVYRNSLAQPDCGTLEKRRRFREPTYKGRIFAKTGYINGVRALSGYCQRRNGKWLAFSILTNTPPASNSVIDKIVKLAID